MAGDADRVRSLDADTIAALATPPGVGGIGVIRVSGPNTPALSRALTGRRLEHGRARLCRFRDGAGEPIDEGLALLFEAPRSFTGETVLELHGHGGPVVMQLLLDAVLAAGARLARPGEFSERAYLNGKIDLTQAEAIADLIQSGTVAAARSALRSLSGGFSERVAELDDALRKLRTFVEAAIDFPDEDLELLETGRVRERVQQLAEGLERLRADARQGNLLNQGASLALIGAPNVGKSSLLNRLAREERAIVTDIPGTTRDLVSADLVLRGLPLRLVDTAGLRATEDPVERQGVARARQQASRADLVVQVRSDGDLQAFEAELVEAGLSGLEVLRVHNKIDLDGTPAGLGADGVVALSALSGAGVDVLEAQLVERLGFQPEPGQFSARQRHLEALEGAQRAIVQAQALAQAGEPFELLAEELRQAHQALGEIIGETTPDALLGEIFASFCIGK